MEIERKFTVKKLPENLSQYPCHIIEQAYLNTDPVVRIRRQDDDYYLTYKGKGLMAREEYNLPLNEPSYYHLRDKADGNVISKKRYVIPIDNPTFVSDCI
ncbi:MAG: CYTH domain-containing protein, partial [Lachnospiraceae bacterium]|nr:CYTH domain-containing protein [Lachnospiraceae bacterium]